VKLVDRSPAGPINCAVGEGRRAHRLFAISSRGLLFRELEPTKTQAEKVHEDFGRPVMQGAEARLDQADGKNSSARRERAGIFNVRTLRIES
jgi:hypothetical protein